MELLSERLRLRLPAEDDAAEALLLLRDPDVAQWNPAPKVVDLDTARNWCRAGADWDNGAHATWHAVDRETGRLLANCSLFAIVAEDAAAKIGYRVAPWARNRGVGREVVDAVTRWAFAERGLVRVQLEHAVVNVASCRVATAAGFRLEGTLRSAYVGPDGVRYDDHVHGRLASDPAPGERPRGPQAR